MTQPNVSAKLDAKTTAPTHAKFAWVALFGFAAVVGASAFALTYHGLFGYGVDIARLAGFAWLVPVAVDGATMFAVAATFLLAAAPLRVRAYAWFVFATMNGLSIAGNLTYAVERHLPWQGALGSATWPGVMTLVAHLGIVVWRHRRPAPPVMEPAARRPVSAPPERQDPPKPATQARRRSPTRPPANEVAGRQGQRDDARRWYAAGVGRGEILGRWNGAGPSRKTVENWTRDLDDVHTAARAALASGGGNGQAP